MGHHFPYGAWDPRLKDWDTGRGTELCANPQGGDHPLHHYVNVIGKWRAPSTLGELFQNANTGSQFTYLSAARNQAGKPYTVDLTPTNIRIVTIPRPTRIIPAAFRPDVSITDSNGRLEPPQKSKDTGIATSHIFEYKGAEALVFSPGDGGVPDQITHGKYYSADYHFHSVPKTLSTEHAKTMFGQLFGLVEEITCGDFQLNTPPCRPAHPQPGASVPESVGAAELEMQTPRNIPLLTPNDCPWNLTIASCCSGGAGVDSR